MSADTLVRSIVVNVGDVDINDSRIRNLFTHPVSGMSVNGIEFPIHKPNRSIKISGRERVGRDQDAQAGWAAANRPPASAFWPAPPLTVGQDVQTEEGCAVSVTNDPGLSQDQQGNYVELAFVYYDPAAPTVGICVAWLRTDASLISRARFTDMALDASLKYVPRQANITLVVLPGITDSPGTCPGYTGAPGLTITGLTGQLEYEIFA